MEDNFVPHFPSLLIGGGSAAGVCPFSCLPLLPTYLVFMEAVRCARTPRMFLAILDRNLNYVPARIEMSAADLHGLNADRAHLDNANRVEARLIKTGTHGGEAAKADIHDASRYADDFRVSTLCESAVSGACARDITKPGAANQ
jgi:hypothetical protein